MLKTFQKPFFLTTMAVAIAATLLATTSGATEAQAPISPPELSTSATDERTPICIAVTGYHTEDPKNKPGISQTSQEIMENIFKNSDFLPTFRTLPQKRALREVKSGLCHAMGGAFYSPEREESYIFSDETFSEIDIVFFKKKGRDIEWNNYEDLEGYVIGAGDGMQFLSELLKSEQINLSLLSSETKNIQNFYRLASGRIDLLVMPRLQGQFIITQKLPAIYQNAFDTLEKPLTQQKVYMMFSKRVDNIEAIKLAFDLGLAQIKLDGTLDRIMEQHFQMLEN